MLLKKVVYGFREMSPEVSIEDAVKGLGEFFGETLWKLEEGIKKSIEENGDNSIFKEIIVSETDDEETKEKKFHLKCKAIHDLLEGYGLEMTFNSDSIMCEFDINVVDEEDCMTSIDKDFNCSAGNSYLLNTLGIEMAEVEDLKDIYKARAKIRKVFEEMGVCFINFKILKLGGKQYSLFTISEK